MTPDEFVDAEIPTVGEPCNDRTQCREWADHTCDDMKPRCKQHCSCRLEEPTTVDISIYRTAENVTDPAEACREFLRLLREDPNPYPLHFEVTPVDGGPTTHVSLTGPQQQAAKA